MSTQYDAILIVSFGGPEHPDDVMPFLENVTRGRHIPRSRLLEVAEHYDHFGGVSPINAQVRELIDVLRLELQASGIAVPIYWGNRNWHPMLAETLSQMTESGVKRALAVVLAAYSSYSSCRQYRENIQQARETAGPEAPQVDKVRVFYNHPDFVAANSDRIREAMAGIPLDQRATTQLAFTAHSIPISMARNCDYEQQLREACRLVAEQLGIESERWATVYQSRSGRPEDPWLEPDILDHLKDLHHRGVKSVAIHPIGFLSDHVEILYDLDDEARRLCNDLGIEMVRSRSVGTHPRFVAMLRELIEERVRGTPGTGPRAIGRFGPNHDVCPEQCCPPPTRPTPARPS